MIFFDCKKFGQKRGADLKMQVDTLLQKGISPKVESIFFTEDSGSELYTNFKKEAAERVGIVYEPHGFSLHDPTEKVIEILKMMNQDPTVTGVMIQKPAKKRWQEIIDNLDFSTWWQALVADIAEEKDVDGLHPNTLLAIEQGTWQAQRKVLPATARAVLEILEFSELQMSYSLAEKKITIIGRSDIFGKPLFYELR